MKEVEAKGGVAPVAVPQVMPGAVSQRTQPWTEILAVLTFVAR